LGPSSQSENGNHIDNGELIRFRPLSSQADRSKPHVAAISLSSGFHGSAPAPASVDAALTGAPGGQRRLRGQARASTTTLR
jgi:hypothetical protein